MSVSVLQATSASMSQWILNTWAFTDGRSSRNAHVPDNTLNAPNIT
jgi:hypothetical protein